MLAACAEAVLLALERDGRRRAMPLARRASTIISRLGRRDDLVLEALEHGQRDGRCRRRGRSASGPRRRPGRSGHGPIEPVEVAALELVRVAAPARRGRPRRSGWRRRRTRPRTPVAASVVKPPADPPRMHSRIAGRRRRARPGAGRTAAQSSTSTTPHWPRSRSRYARPYPVEPRWLTSTTAKPRGRPVLVRRDGGIARAAAVGAAVDHDDAVAGVSPRRVADHIGIARRVEQGVGGRLPPRGRELDRFGRGRTTSSPTPQVAAAPRSTSGSPAAAPVDLRRLTT